MRESRTIKVKANSIRGTIRWGSLTTQIRGDLLN